LVGGFQHRNYIVYTAYRMHFVHPIAELAIAVAP
jgi:hypothetical protein